MRCPGTVAAAVDTGGCAPGNGQLRAVIAVDSGLVVSLVYPGAQKSPRGPDQPCEDTAAAREYGTNRLSGSMTARRHHVRLQHLTPHGYELRDSLVSGPFSSMGLETSTWMTPKLPRQPLRSARAHRRSRPWPAAVGRLRRGRPGSAVVGPASVADGTLAPYVTRPDSHVTRWCSTTVTFRTGFGL